MGVVALLAGCVGQPLAPKVQRALDVLECQLERSEALIPSAAIAEQVVLAARAGDATAATQALLQLGMNLGEIQQVAIAIAECNQP